MAKNAKKSEKLSRQDKYKRILDQVAGLMDDATGFWAKPWSCIPPHNASSGKVYRGINTIVLWFISSLSYGSNGWLTYKQAKDLGGSVKKGERGITVIYWQPLRVAEKDENGEETGETKTIFFEKLYTVFNVEQCEGIDESKLKAPKGFKSFVRTEAEHPERVERAIEFCNSVGAKYNEVKTGDRACYRPSTDEIELPDRSLFMSDAAYLSTRFHELGHWTGHDSRLDRSLCTKKGTEDYAQEELVAEFASAILCSLFGIEGNGLQHPEYLAVWRSRCSDDPKVVIHAGQRAQKAVDYLIEQAEKSGYEFVETDDNDDTDKVASAA